MSFSNYSRCRKLRGELEFVVQARSAEKGTNNLRRYARTLFAFMENERGERLWLKGNVNSSDYSPLFPRKLFFRSGDWFPMCVCNEMSQSRAWRINKRTVVLYILDRSGSKFLLRMHDIGIDKCMRLRAFVSFYRMLCYVHVRISVILFEM